MNNRYFVLIIIFLACFIQRTNAQYLQFVENKGQWDKFVKFKANFQGGDLLLQPSGYKVILHNKDDLKKISNYFGGHFDSSAKTDKAPLAGLKAPALKLHSHAYQVSFIGADTNAVVEPDKALNTINNYFIGKDSSKWASGCRLYNGITFKNIYKNVDVRYFSDNGNLSYDLIINPGADVSKIALKFDGLNNLAVNKYGNLTMSTSVGDIYQSIPSTYQINKSVKTKVKAAFIVKDNIVQFKLGNYDKNATLIIDPTEIFSTFVGSLTDDWGYTATYDNEGNFYAGGIAFGAGFVNRGVGGYDETYNGGDGSEGSDIACDISIIKFNPTGTLALYSTYLGGSGDEQPHSLVVDSRGNLVIAGRTTSTDFPETVSKFGPAQGAGDFDIVLAKLSADGKSLLASRKFGGKGWDGVNIAPKYSNSSTGGNPSIRRNYGDDAHSEVITDNSDNIYLASCTQSADFPTTSNAFRKNLGGKQDGVFIKVSSDLTNIFNCSMLGGDGDDAAFVLNISKATGNIFIAGGTTSTDLNKNAVEAQGILHTKYQGGECDGFISEISSDGNTLLKTLYVGTPGNDIVYGVQTDKYGYPFITGTTTQAFPVLNSPFNAAGNQANGKQFITKLNADLTQVLYNANFGKGLSTPDISPTAFLVDICDNVYVSGWGGSANFEYNRSNTLIGMPTTANALLRTTDGNDFYFFVLEKNASSQLFGSFFGTEGDPKAYGDHVDGGTSRFDRRGVIYQAICANCNKQGVFPTTTGSWSPGNPAQDGARCNEAGVKIAFELSGVIASLRSTINGAVRDSVGCVPLTVDFTDTIALGKKYIWSFGDGSADVTTAVPNTSHTYLNVGDYKARVISIDSASCNTADTAYLTIKARNNRARLSYTISKLPPCQSLNYEFTNTSVAPAGFPFTANDFTWDFGDGTKIASNATTVQHSYASPGTYFVKLYLDDTIYCNSPDSAVTQLRVASILVAQFQTPSIGCTPYNAVFNNTSLGGQQFVWDFGDGSTSTDPSPTHLYANPGTYTIHLSATDNLTCNPTDDTSLSITVIEGPLASFTFSPVEPKENTPFQFTNLSTNAVRYKWDFGDGDTLLTSDLLTPVSHLFNTTGTFMVCLIALNANGCTDTSCQQINAVVAPLADVPNAFSPNSDGTNDVISVKGYGVAKMSWNIYNRWGKLVFTSTSISNGWDGRYKGEMQPQDVYAYILNITFTDNTVFRKKGDITLLR